MPQAKKKSIFIAEFIFCLTKKPLIIASLFTSSIINMFVFALTAIKNMFAMFVKEKITAKKLVKKSLKKL